ncbi:TPA: AAA family ATPase [Legionella pneumophila]
MNNIKKEHAKDYLIEYISSNQNNNWLSLLIQKIISTNGRVNALEKQDIFHQLLYEYSIESNQLSLLSREELNNNYEESGKGNKELFLKKIKHISGVNALVSDVPIILSQSCTIFYGLNGTGKSGYFRILNELSGGTKPKQILSNIRKQSEDSLEVEIEYSHGDEIKSYKWENKGIRGIAPFSGINVFDSEYLPIYLNERESSVNLEPLGLHLFQCITLIIEEFKNELTSKKDLISNNKPSLQELINIIHAEELKNILQKNKLSENDRKKLDNYQANSAEDDTTLEQLYSERKTLENNNTVDRLKILTQEKKEIDSIKNHLFDTKNEIQGLGRKMSNAINNCIDKKKIRDQRAKEFEIIKNIPEQNSEEWQNFIESAEEYKSIIKNSDIDKLDNCIYCNQPLGETAIKLLHAYTQYLGDQSQHNYKVALNILKVLEQEVDLLITDFNFSEFLNTHLMERKISKLHNAKDLILEALKSFAEQKELMKNTISNMRAEPLEYDYDLSQITETLSELSKIKQDELDNNNKTEEQKQSRIIEINLLCNAFEDRKQINKWKKKIEQHFAANKEIEKYLTAIKKLSTRDITQLSSKAHNELLTESMRKSFESMLKALRKDIEVTFSKPRGDKGSVHTKLEILGNDVAKILSDGEQKAVALALFLAEIENQNDISPIVFDDPVTSVDHEVADLLSKKLLELSKIRQIIIFTHNKLFYSSFMYWGNNLKDAITDIRTHHICKNYTQSGCNAKGEHIYTYRIDKEDNDNTGKIFEAQNECCRYFIEKAEQELKKEYSVSSVAGYLKSAIEHYIDENILLSIGLLKDRNRGIGINWEKLKAIESKKEILEKLKEYWDELSSRGTHSSQGAEQNPIQLFEFNQIITFIKEN